LSPLDRLNELSNYKIVCHANPNSIHTISRKLRGCVFAKNRTPRICKWVNFWQGLNASNDQPIEFATVALFSLRDSSLVTGGITDINGELKIESIPYGPQSNLISSALSL
jgi:hypothetical protein